MKGVQRDDASGKVEFGQQLLRSRDFIGFCVYLDMRDGQRRLGGKRAEDLFGSPAVKGVEASSQDLAVDRKNPTLTLWKHARGIQICGVRPERCFDMSRIQSAQDRPD